MRFKNNIALIIACASLAITLATAFWVYQNSDQYVNAHNFEDLLEEAVKENPKLLVNLLNDSANIEQMDQQNQVESFIFKNKSKILSSGFLLKKTEKPSSKSLVVFIDMTCPHCITFLKNINLALQELESSVVIIPISVLGEKSSQEARLIMAASLQDPEKAVNLALTYDAVNLNNNNRMADATVIGLDSEKLSQTMNSKAIVEAVDAQTKLSEAAKIPGIPCIFLISDDAVHFLPPAEAKDLKNLVLNPEQETDDESEEN
jgi:protein-disulfide isomerase